MGSGTATRRDRTASQDAHGALRVLIVEFLPAGGLYQFSVQLAEGIAAAGDRDVDVTILTGPDPEPPPADSRVTLRTDLPTWRPGRDVTMSTWRRSLRRVWRAARYLAAWQRVVAIAHSMQPDVIVFSDWHFAIDDVMLRRIVPDPASARRPVLAAVAHTPVPWDRFGRNEDLHRRGGIVRRAFADAYRRMDVVFVLGEKSRRQLLDAYPDVHEVAVLPHGDESHFRRHMPAVPAVGSTDPVALFFGNLDRYKGVERLVAVWPDVRRRVPDARCRIRGAAGDGVDVRSLSAAAHAAGVDLEVGWVPEDDVAGEVAAARCIVAPYRAANQSGVVHLAQTFARPVVVTAVGDLAASVDDGVTGRVVAPDDDDALVDAVASLLGDRNEAQRMGGAAAKRATSWDAVGREVLSALYNTPAPPVGTLR